MMILGRDLGFTLGQDNADYCSSVSKCNGELTGGVYYSLKVRFYTERGFADSNIIHGILPRKSPIYI